MARDATDLEDDIRGRWDRLSPTLDERGRRLFAANEAVAIGFGGVAAVHRATSVARSTIRRGIAELDDLERLAPPEGMQRNPGAGRKKATEKQEGLLAALEVMIEPATRGDPESPLRWVSRSVRRLASALQEQGFEVTKSTVLLMLRGLGFTLQKTRKTLEGANHPDRDAQFAYINDFCARMQSLGQPVISVDTKKKELVGLYQNAGSEWHPKGEAPAVLTYDFPNGTPKAVPYGVYDTVRNEGFVTVGISSDTAEFATAAIYRWWTQMGRKAYPNATDLVITADCGGSNGYRLRLWKLKLQELADKMGVTISVCHLPPGTSKWNKIEHRLFSFISMNWKGRPLVSYEAIVELIGSTRTSKGLVVRCELDEGEYARGIAVTDEELARVFIEPDSFHGEWNYTIVPTQLAT